MFVCFVFFLFFFVNILIEKLFYDKDENEMITSVVVLLFLGFLFIIVGVLVYYFMFQCPGGGLSACTELNRGKCGFDHVQSKEECSSFVRNNETCYCEACVLCQVEKQRQQCARSVEIRIEECENSFP
jgi:hypothetical protein